MKTDKLVSLIVPGTCLLDRPMLAVVLPDDDRALFEANVTVVV